MSDPTQTTGTPAASASTPPPAGATTTPPASGDWISQLDADSKGYLENKGIKDPAILLKSYRNLESHMGTPAERLLRLPDNTDDAVAMGEVYKKLGRPDKAEDYGIKAKADDPNSKSFVDFVTKAFHEKGVSKKQAEGIVAAWNTFQENADKQMKQTYTDSVEKQSAELKTKWGTAFDQNIKVAQLAFRELGLDSATVDKMESVMGFAPLMESMHKIGMKVGEPDFHTGEGGGGLNKLTPDGARSRKYELMNDKAWVDKFLSGDVASKNEMDRLDKAILGME